MGRGGGGGGRSGGGGGGGLPAGDRAALRQFVAGISGTTDAQRIALWRQMSRFTTGLIPERMRLPGGGYASRALATAAREAVLRTLPANIQKALTSSR